MKHARSIPILSASFMALTVLVTQPSMGQLSSQDVAGLRAEGQIKGWTFTVGETDAISLPLSALCGDLEPVDSQQHEQLLVQTPPGVLPSRFDWRDWGGCTPIRNQGQCGSCWAFGAMGPVESFVRISTFNSVNLSEQWLISCTGAGSCGGGWFSDALNYLSCAGWTDSCGGVGAVLESDSPYMAQDTWCECPYAHPYCIPGWYYVGNADGVPDVSRIKQAILDHGPVVARVAVLAPFQAYTGGVFNACASGTLNHAIVLVGWDDNQGAGGVWFLRNSWGANWGESNGYAERGYMRIEYGCCSVGSAAAYVNYSTQPLITLPFTESFATTTIDAGRWYVITNAEVNAGALGEPSSPNSLNLKGSSAGGDSISTACIDTSSLGDITLRYSYERTGGGDAPEADDDLVVEYLNSSFQWIELGRQPGSGPSMTAFASATHTISSAAAKHRYFRIRFRVASSSPGKDDWFIDDLSITASGTGDREAPQPNPMTYAAAPAPAGTTAIAMTATTATDAGSPPVQYFFNIVSGGAGGADSGWQSGTNYTNAGLKPNTAYTYRVKARDSASAPNETGYSANASTATLIEAPTGVWFGTVTADSIVVNVANTLTNLTTGQSGVYFNSETAGGRGGINAWVQTATDTAVGLSPNTTYGFQAAARNQNGVQTPACATTYVTTRAAVPGAPLLSYPTATSLQMGVSPSGNPADTEFAIQCTSSSPYDADWDGKYVSAYGFDDAEAAWQTCAEWETQIVYGLEPGTQYTFCTKARNKDGIETAWSYSSSLTTDSLLPSPNPISPCGLGFGLAVQGVLCVMLIRLGRRTM